MNAREFLTTMADEYGGNPTPGKLSRLGRAVGRFTPDQIQQICDAVLSNSKIFPRVAHVMEQARELGLLATPPRRSSTHYWKRTDCRLCCGEGRLGVWYSIFVRPEGKGVQERREAVLPLSEQPPNEIYADHNIICRTYRCSCPAGKASTIPKGWAFWLGSGFGKVVEDPEPTHEDVKQAQSFLANLGDTPGETI